MQEQRRLRQTAGRKDSFALNIDLRFTYFEHRPSQRELSLAREEVHREAQFGKPFILAHIRNATGTEEEIGMTEVLMKGG